MLNEEERKYIKRALTKRLKYLRYMVYAMIMICLLFIALPMTFRYLLDGDILHAITSILGIIYPIMFFGGFYLLFEFISGNQIFIFIKGNYIVSREIIYNKYRTDSMVSSSIQGKGTHWLRQTSNYFCDTQNHTRVLFIDDESYRNAEIGKTAIVIQFGKNANNIEAFVLPQK